MQLEGSALRIHYEDLRKLYRSSEEIRDHVLEFVQEQALIVSQIACCNRLHDAEVRFARWLLMARDRTGSNEIHLTHEFLGMMLGTGRPTVSLISATLQRRGILASVRSHITILDGLRLEELACDCYRAIKKLHTDLYQSKACMSLV